MSDLLRRIDAHLTQCHRHDDDSELLLVEAKAEIDRLTHEMEATKEAARAREAMLREALEPFADVATFFESETQGLEGRDQFELTYEESWVAAHFTVAQFYAARAALNGEAGQ